MAGAAHVCSSIGVPGHGGRLRALARAGALLLVALVTPLAGLAASEADFSARALRLAAAEHPHVRASFRQIKDLELFDQPVVTPGVIEISRPQASVRWEFSERAVLLLRNDQLHRFRADGTRDHVRGDPANRALEGQMRALLSGDWHALDRLFVVTVAPAARAVVLEPRDPELARYVSRVEAVYGDDLLLPATLEITAPSGDRTRYEFAAPERPGEIAVARFTAP